MTLRRDLNLVVVLINRCNQRGDSFVSPQIDSATDRTRNRIRPYQNVLDRLAIMPAMPDVTQILSAIREGDPQAFDELLPVVYRELRRLAAQKLRREAPGQTIQATALVHEVYLRLVGPNERNWEDPLKAELV